MQPDSLSHDLPQGQEALPPFESLYDRYHVQVYRYLYAHLGNEHDAADLMQHVFFQAWKHGQAYNPRRGTFATWLLSIAHNRLVDFYRVSRPSLSWESIPEITELAQNPEDKVISEETITHVRKILEALPQPEQELLALRFAVRLSSAEIASLIGKSEAATKLVSLASPQNPSGVAIPSQTLYEVMALLEQRCPGAYLLVDET